MATPSHFAFVAAFAVASAFGIAGCSSDPQSPPPSRPSSTSPAETPQPTASDTVATGDPVTSDTAEAPAETFTMPQLVGLNLQLAQDTLQNLGSYAMDQQDASGLGRIQVLDSNWQVCTQSPAAGEDTPTDTLVVLASVKLDEVCP